MKKDDLNGRRPIAAVVYSGQLVVVCDDGSMWRFPAPGGSWVEMAPIPGSRSDAEDQN